LLTTNKNLKIYRMDIGIDKLEMIHEDHHGHGKHKHKLFHDPHIWLSFDNMIIIANNTKKALVELDPSNKVYYENNYESLIEEIIKIKNKAKDELKFKKDKSFLVFHPAWGYLAKEFSLNQIAVEVEGKEPSPKEMKTIIDTARSKGINVIFIQPQISTKTVDKLSKELNATIIKINPLEYNWLKNMKYVLDNIAKGLK
ncbi:MAG: zinc ABC transporter substrate-binding protein, partial [Deferribacterales bacterium]